MVYALVADCCPGDMFTLNVTELGTRDITKAGDSTLDTFKVILGNNISFKTPAMCCYHVCLIQGEPPFKAHRTQADQLAARNRPVAFWESHFAKMAPAKNHEYGRRGLLLIHVLVQHIYDSELRR